MRLFQPTKALTFWLVVLLAIPQPLSAQTRKPLPLKKPPQANLPKANLIAAAVNDLLKEKPLDSTEPEAASDSESDDENPKPPADDAPIHELIAYWTLQGFKEFDQAKAQPSDKVRQRFLDYLENRPWMAAQLAHYLPETPDTYDRLYKVLREEADDRDRSNWQNVLRRKLMFNSSYFREDLINEAQRFSQNNYPDYSALQALANLDWDAAKPVVEGLLKAPLPSQSVPAQAMMYEQAAKANDASLSESLRAQLKLVVANRSLGSERQAALVALMGTEWSGRDEWYASLFADPSLSGVQIQEKIAAEKPGASPKDAPPKGSQVSFDEHDPASNVLWIPMMADAEKLLPVVIGLIGNGNRVVHLAAVSALSAFLINKAEKEELRKLAARALLPWLSEPDWGGKFERWSFLESLTKLRLPESVPGLIWVLDYDDLPENRGLAAEALRQYKNPQAIPALRRALNRTTDEFSRDNLIVALAELGGIPDAEAVAAIEAYARRMLTEEGQTEIREARQGGSEKPLPLPISIGAVFAENEDAEISDGVATLLFNRAKALKRTQPDLARKLVSIAQQSNGIVADLHLVEHIAEGWVDVEALKLALESRAQLRKTVAGNLEELFNQGGYQTGLAAVILNEEDKLNRVLAGRDSQAQLALLAAARYTRAKLPVESVGKLLANASLTSAAESYLEVEDSAEARKLIWARHPGEARILGEGRDRGFNDEVFYAPRPSGAVVSEGSQTLSKWEDKMRDEVRRPNGPEEIYAIVPGQSPGIYNSIIIRVGKTGAEISLHQAEGRRLWRKLDSSELQELKDLASREEIENLGPENPIGLMQFYPHVASLQFEYLRLTKDGGRRIMLSQLRREPKQGATLHEQLSGLFYRLSKTGEYKLRYAMEDLIPGVEVLLADDKRPVISVCQESGQVRVFVAAERPDTPYQNVSPNTSQYEWRALASGQLGAQVDDVPNCQSGNQLLNLPDWLRDLRVQTGLIPDHRARLGNVWFAQSGIENEYGIWKFEEGKAPVKVIAGGFSNLIVTPDGKWLVALKIIESEEKFEQRVVRIQLATGREYPITGTAAATLFPVAYVAAHNKLLLSQQTYQFREDGKGTFFLLDAETGAIQPVKG
ncbi:MAG: HEAT repeat domain-containing protein, partial [Acidobacteria bacterium]|nr:HEAT repeat domain-containing protein [Acidobacteriota bacterium]